MENSRPRLLVDPWLLRAGSRYVWISPRQPTGYIYSTATNIIGCFDWPALIYFERWNFPRMYLLPAFFLRSTLNLLEIPEPEM
jgi:hypothetical protein